MTTRRNYVAGEAGACGVGAGACSEVAAHDEIDDLGVHAERVGDDVRTSLGEHSVEQPWREQPGRRDHSLLSTGT
jgi:hypothetical protein